MNIRIFFTMTVILLSLLLLAGTVLSSLLLFWTGSFVQGIFSAVISAVLIFLYSFIAQHCR